MRDMRQDLHDQYKHGSIVLARLFLIVAVLAAVLATYSAGTGNFSLMIFNMILFVLNALGCIWHYHQAGMFKRW